MTDEGGRKNPSVAFADSSPQKGSHEKYYLKKPLDKIILRCIMILIKDVFFGIAVFSQCEIFLKEWQNELILLAKCAHFHLLQIKNTLFGFWCRV